MQKLVGIDHIAIGPDYMPEPNKYAIGGHTRGTIPSLAELPSLVLALVNDPAGYTDDDIKKMLGGNLRDLYQRVWDPTHGYDGGAAHFRRCSNTDPHPSCVAARSNSGQGDLRHRAINCQHPSDNQPVGLQLRYQSGEWKFFNLSGTLVSCVNGSTLVVSWGDGEPANGRLALYGTPACDAACQQAITSAGAGTNAGTNNARALSCGYGNPASGGIVGLQLAYTSGAWRFYNIAGQLVPCSGNSTLIANWDIGPTTLPNASVRLCDDYNNHPACAAAALNGGTGTAQAKALNCLNSDANAASYGTVALQVAYAVDPLSQPPGSQPTVSRWFYYDTAGYPHRCVHGSVLVATTL